MERRCPGRFGFASRLVALLSMTVDENPFSGGSSNGGFWSWRVEYALSFNGD
jgi:hypothetical protein